MTALAQARRWEVPLRVTLAAAVDGLVDWAERVRAHAGLIEAVCVVDPGTHTSTPSLVAALASRLQGSGIAVGGGTRGYVAEYGRSGSGFEGSEFVQVSVSAEMHHTEAERVFDTLRALPYAVAAIRARSGAPIVVAPVTLARRMSLHAGDPDEYGPWSPAWAEDHRGAGPFGSSPTS